MSDRPWCTEAPALLTMAWRYHRPKLPWADPKADPCGDIADAADSVWERTGICPDAVVLCPSDAHHLSVRERMPASAWDPREQMLRDRNVPMQMTISSPSGPLRMWVDDSRYIGSIPAHSGYVLQGCVYVLCTQGASVMPQIGGGHRFKHPQGIAIVGVSQPPAIQRLGAEL